ncbi:MAG: response regulator [Candidatus Kapabacteria bacterium]|nr:response regulator [Candidatus Kapabacteria bacterium]
MSMTVESQSRLYIKALLVEDSALDADVLVRFLRYHDIEVTYERVDTIPQLQAALEQDWDIIFCDYNIYTGFTGVDAIQIIRARERNHQAQHHKPCYPVPIIIISSVLNESAIVAAMNAGASDFIVKGYLERLVPLLRREMTYITTIRRYFNAWKDAERRLNADAHIQ